MMTSTQVRKQLWAGALAMALAGSAVWMPGCGGEEEAAPAASAAAPAAAGSEAKPADAAPAPAASTPAPAGSAAKAEAVPAANADYSAVLRWRPEATPSALIVPSVAGLQEKLLPAAQRFAPDMDLKAELEAAVKDVASDAGVEAATIEDLALAKGLNPAAPLAAFIGYASMTDEIKEDAAEAKTEAPADDAAAADDADEAGDTDAADDTDGMMEMEAEPDMVVVAGVSDAAKAEALVKELAEANPETAGKGIAEEDYNGTALKIIDPEELGYFIAGDQLILSNRLELLKAAADRAKSPAPTAFSAGDLPVGDAEVLSLVYGGSMMSGIFDAMSAMGESDPGAAAMMSVMSEFKDAYVSEGEPEPTVSVVDVTNEKLSVVSSLDLAKYPKLKEYVGDAAVLNLATKLPDTTQVMLAQRIAPELKAKLTQSILPNVIKAAQDPGAQMAGPVAIQVLDMIGDELALGIAPIEGDFPALVLMVALADPAGLQGMLEMVAAPVETDAHRDVKINQITSVPVPIEFSFAVAGNTLVVSNNVEQIKQTIDRLLDNKNSELFASVTPAMAIDTPRYNIFYIDTRLVTDVILPLSSLAGGLPGDSGDIADLIASNVSQVRQLQEMDGTRAETSFEIFLKPATAMEAAPAMEDAPAADAPAADDAGI